MPNYIEVVNRCEKYVDNLVNDHPELLDFQTLLKRHRSFFARQALRAVIREERLKELFQQMRDEGIRKFKAYVDIETEHPRKPRIEYYSYEIMKSCNIDLNTFRGILTVDPEAESISMNGEMTIVEDIKHKIY